MKQELDIATLRSRRFVLDIEIAETEKRLRQLQARRDQIHQELVVRAPRVPAKRSMF